MMNIMLPKGQDALCKIDMMEDDGLTAKTLLPSQGITLSIVEKKKNREVGEVLAKITGTVTDFVNGKVEFLITEQMTQAAYIKVGENEDGFPFMSEYYGILYVMEGTSVIGIPTPLDIIFVP